MDLNCYCFRDFISENFHINIGDNWTPNKGEEAVPPAYIIQKYPSLIGLNAVAIKQKLKDNLL